MEAKKKFVAVIGYGKSGKSTIISSLTGCRISTFRGFIADETNNISVFVCSGSPQEEPKINLDVIEEWLRQCIDKSGCSGIVMAIQPTNHLVRTSMEEIVTEATSQGFDVYAFVIEPGYKEAKKCYEDVRNRLLSIGCSIF